MKKITVWNVNFQRNGVMDDGTMFIQWNDMMPGMPNHKTTLEPEWNDGKWRALEEVDSDA